LLLKQEFKEYEKGGFAIPTGKIELYSALFEERGYDQFPNYDESPVRTPELLHE
jgi:hypothetical protein